MLSKAFSGKLIVTNSLEAKAPASEASSVLAYPSRWNVPELGCIADIELGITLGKKRKPEDKLKEYPYLRVANVQRGWLDLREIKTIAVTSREAEVLFLRHGDVLINEGGDRDSSDAAGHRRASRSMHPPEPRLQSSPEAQDFASSLLVLLFQRVWPKAFLR